METKKIYLEQLISKIKSLTEDYEIDENEVDVLILKIKDLGSFSEELLQIVNDYIKTEVMPETEVEEDEEDFYVTDWFDDDLD